MNNVTEFVNKNVDAKLVMMMSVVNEVTGYAYDFEAESGWGIVIYIPDGKFYLELITNYNDNDVDDELLVCTDDELGKLIVELTEAAWLNKDYLGEPQSYKAYKAAYADMLEAGLMDD